MTLEKSLTHDQAAIDMVAQVACETQRAWIVRIISIVSGAGSIIYGFVKPEEGMLPIQIILGLLLIFFGVVGMNILMRMQVRKGAARVHGTTSKYTIDDRGIVVESEFGEVYYRWAQVVKAFTRKEWLVVLTEDNNCILTHLADLSTEEVDWIKEKAK